LPVLLKNFDELKSRVLVKAKDAVRKVKVTKAPDFSKVKVLTNRRMYVIVVPSDRLDETLENVKKEVGKEDLEVEVHEVKKPLYKK